MKNPAPFLFSEVAPDPVGEQLGTDFFRFRTPTRLHGLACVASERLDILAVIADAPGKGHFRDFITTAKAHFGEIGVWSVHSPHLALILLRYGFERGEHRFAGERSSVHGLVWRRA